MIEHLTVETFPTKVLANPQLVVIDVWAAWCRPCRAMSPIFSQIAQQFAEQARFFKMDADENPELTRKYGLTSIPTLLYFRHGKLLDRKTGLQPLEVVVQRLTSLLTLTADEVRREAMHGQFTRSKCEFWG